MHVKRIPVPTRAALALAAVALTAGGIMATATAVNAAPPPNPHPSHSPNPHSSKSANPQPTNSTAPTLDPTELRISNKVIAHGKHHGVTINGVLSSDDTGVAGETITLEDRSGVKPRWTVVTTGTTATGGTVSFTVAPKVKTQYKLVFAGDSTYRGSDSNVITLRPVK